MERNIWYRNTFKEGRKIHKLYNMYWGSLVIHITRKLLN